MTRTDAPAPRLRFIEALRAKMMEETEVHDLSRNPGLAGFQFVGYHPGDPAEFLAFTAADAASEAWIVARCDEFLEVVRSLPRALALGARGRKVGLLCFVFANGCTARMARFICGQTRFSPESGGAAAVAWAIDARTREVHTHAGAVSVFPPLRVDPRTVFPGLDYLEEAVRTLPPIAEAPPAPAPAPATDERMRILFLGANSTVTPLDLEWEFGLIDDSLKLSPLGGRIELKQVWALTVDRLTRALLAETPTIVHFSGHGKASGIMLRDETGEPYTVPGEALAGLFELFKDTVQCVVLNACYSEEQARAIRRHIPHVIGIRAGAEDGAAAAFSTGFYQAIGAGKDVPFAFELGIRRARLEGITDEIAPVLL